VAAWAGGLAAVVAIAALGQGEDRTEAVTGILPATSPTGAADVARPSPVIVLEQPSREGLLIRPTDLLVSGHLREGSGPVRLLVETARNKPIAVRLSEPSDPPSSGAGGSTRFAFTVPLVDPREGERLIIHVIAYDGDGVPIEAVRRRVVVGPHEPGVFGEDGLMGGIPFPSDRP
jgi:hypothetical protein